MTITLSIEQISSDFLSIIRREKEEEVDEDGIRFQDEQGRRIR